MVTDQITEVIFVGLPGPTHHYGGLSGDNVASNLNRGSVSNPRQAALQVLDLLRLQVKIGIPTAVLPPQLRPNIALLRQHFTGDAVDVIHQAAMAAPNLLEKASSASAMWTANAATVAPGVDAGDGKLHITAANLFTNLHRRIEAEDSYRVLREIFANAPDSVVHAPLSAAMGLCDEGAANHMRLAPGHSARGLHVFVYGADGSARDPGSARQTLSASKAIQALHRLSENETLFLRQNREAIAAGVFHNDVIAVSNEYVLLVHEKAYAGGEADIERIAHAFRALHPGAEPVVIIISDDDLSLEEAVHTYFFNSQLVTRPDGGMSLIAPAEVQLLYEGKAEALIARIIADSKNPIDQVHYADLRQSMRNGGGPACLRLRVPMNQKQLSVIAGSGVMVNDKLLAALERTIKTHYPEELTPLELGDPHLYITSQHVLAELSEAMQLPLLG